MINLNIKSCKRIFLLKNDIKTCELITLAIQYRERSVENG